MAESDSDRDAVVAATVGEIIGRLHNRMAEVTRRTQQVLVTEISELREDSQLLELLGDTVTANVETVFAAMQNNIPLEQIEPPAMALEYARRLAQRDVASNVLVRAYRIGHQTILETMVNELRTCELDAASTLDVTGRMTTSTFEYIDWISQRVITTYHDERDRWNESRNYVRASHVRELLDGGDIDIDAMTMSIRYPLQRTHLALVAWCHESPTGNETALLEQFIHRLASSIGDREACLYIPADRLTAWAWIPFPADEPPADMAPIRKIVAENENSPFVAIGRALPGVAGFRRSHQQALDARRVALTNHARTDRVIEANDPGILLASLLEQNIEAARRWVGEVLGPLADANDNDERLRETLRLFLQTGSSFTASATELHLHFNTVRYRVGRAVARRGKAIDDDRLDVEVALMLCRLLGDAVLNKS
jgi:hypothetical protein